MMTWNHIIGLWLWKDVDWGVHVGATIWLLTDFSVPLICFLYVADTVQAFYPKECANDLEASPRVCESQCGSRLPYL